MSMLRWQCGASAASKARTTRPTGRLKLAVTAQIGTPVGRQMLRFYFCFLQHNTDFTEYYAGAPWESHGLC